MEQDKKPRIQITEEHRLEAERIINRGHQAEIKVEKGQVRIVEVRRQLKI